MDQDELERAKKDQLERAKIAMEEYKVIHAELLVRYSTVIRILMGAVAAIVAIIGFGTSGSLNQFVMVGLILFILVLVAFAWNWIDGDVRNAAHRLMEIETYVNNNVEGGIDHPLTWVRRFGLLSVSYSDRIFRRNSMRKPR